MLRTGSECDPLRSVPFVPAHSAVGPPQALHRDVMHRFSGVDPVSLEEVAAGPQAQAELMRMRRSRMHGQHGDLSRYGNMKREVSRKPGPAAHGIDGNRPLEELLSDFHQREIGPVLSPRSRHAKIEARRFVGEPAAAALRPSAGAAAGSVTRWCPLPQQGVQAEGDVPQAQVVSGGDHEWGKGGRPRSTAPATHATVSKRASGAQALHVGPGGGRGGGGRSSCRRRDDARWVR